MKRGIHSARTLKSVIIVTISSKGDVLEEYKVVEDVIDFDEIGVHNSCTIFISIRLHGLLSGSACCKLKYRLCELVRRAEETDRW